MPSARCSRSLWSVRASKSKAVAQIIMRASDRRGQPQVDRSYAMSSKYYCSCLYHRIPKRLTENDSAAAMPALQHIFYAAERLSQAILLETTIESDRSADSGSEIQPRGTRSINILR